MLSGINVRAFNNQAPPLAIRQQVSFGTESLSLIKLDRKIVVAALLLCGLILSASQIIHWKVNSQNQAYMKAQGVHATLTNDNIALRASRASMMSKQRIARIAEAELQLTAPTRAQEHLL